jgi:hypothetical protein
MPTTVTRTVKASGGDYTSVASFEAAENGGLVAANEIRVADCFDLGSFESTGLVIAGGTTDATRYLVIQAHDNHNGLWSTSSYGIGGVFGTCITNQQDWTRLLGLKVSVVASGGFGGTGISASQVTVIERNIIQGPGASFSSASSNTLAIVDNTTANGLYVGNNFIYNFYSDLGGNAYGMFSTGFAQTKFYNNTLYKVWIGAAGNTGGGGTGILAKNNVAQACSVCYSGLFDGSSVTNISNDGTHPAGKTATVSFVSTTVGSEDLHLAAGDTQAVGYGTDVSADATYSLTVDIDNVVRAIPFDAGADQGSTVSVFTGYAYLLERACIALETGDILLLENGDKLLNEEAYAVDDNILLEDGSGLLLLDIAPFIATPAAATNSWVGNAPAIAAGGISATPSIAISTWANNAPAFSLALSLTPNPAIANWTNNNPTTTPGATSSTTTASVASWNNTTPGIALALSQTTTSSVSTWVNNTPAISLALTKATTVSISSWVANPPSVAASLSLATNASVSSWVVNAPTVSSAFTQTTQAATSSWVTNSPGVVLGTVAATPAPATGLWTVNSPAGALGTVSITTQAAVSNWISNNPSVAAALTLNGPPAVSSWVANNMTLNVVTGILAGVAISNWVVNSPAVSIGFTLAPAVSNWVVNSPSVSALGIVGATVGQLFPTGYR